MPKVIGQVIQSFLGGALIAVVVTVVHAESFPWVLAGGLAVVACYLVALRLLETERIVTIAGAAGVLVTVLVLAQRSPGGSILIAANDAGNVWVIGASLLAGLTSAWPRISSPVAR
jgi:N-acetyl-1-D-myo-inositol-2-amino-2-deoxy-alpha-D-glucopyranoside deacetylase